MTSYNYSAGEVDSFTNGAIEGSLGWYTSMGNDFDNTGESVTGLQLSLTNQNESPAFVDQAYFPEAGNYNNVPTSPLWTFPEIVEGNGAGVNLSIPTSTSFSPGFSVVRTTSNTITGATGDIVDQELSVTVTVQELVNQLYVQVNTWEDDAINPEVTGSTYSVVDAPDTDITISHDKYIVQMWINNPVVGGIYELKTNISINLKQPLNGIDTKYQVHVGSNMISNNTACSSSVSEFVDGLGTWNWTANGAYFWHWNQAVTRWVHLESYWKVPTGPRITSVNPGEGVQGQNLDVTVSGAGFTQDTTVDFGDGIIVDSLQINSPENLTAYLSIAPDAAVGLRDVVVSGSGVSDTLVAGFTVVQAPPKIFSINPNRGNRGQTLNVDINGNSLNGATKESISFGDGISVQNVVVNVAGTVITATIKISWFTYNGQRDVSVTTQYGTSTLDGGFIVGIARPSIIPDQGIQGQSYQVIITGTNLVGTTAVNFGNGITTNYIVNSSTQIIADIAISPSATLGYRNVSITTPEGTVTKYRGFIIKPPAPTLSSISPTQGNKGQTINVSIYGEYLSGATRSSVNFGNSIRVNTVTSVDSGTRLIVNITINRFASAGLRDVEVTTPGGTALLVGAFTVK
jgi:hypothetical protein